MADSAPGGGPHGPAPRSADRLRDLLEAHRTVTSDLSEECMLNRILAAGCRLVGAASGALSVLDADGGDRRVLRRGPQAGAGPAADTLRAPIRVRGEAFAELEVREPLAGAFSTEDAQLLAAFATTAGTAIENAHLHDDARRSREWLDASGQVARALLADARADTLLDVVASARRVAEADYGALILPAGGDRMEVAAAVGRGADRFCGYAFEPERSSIGRAILAGRSVLSRDIAALASSRFTNTDGYGALLVVPIADARAVRGALVLIRTLEGPAFTSRDLELAGAFAAQMAVALDASEARDIAQSLRALEHRHRDAQDLHDQVIQRLFATGVGLEYLARKRLPDELADRLRQHIRELDETIDEIRSRVFGSSLEQHAR
ncbi:MAG TPA: GAF domain-containing protein [Jatrophihabitans sp.]|nr:GAF domain-containing protein [Jatrophihabitans sp.]